MADEMGLLITGGSDFHGMERSGSDNTDEWLHKTRIPYDLVAAIKECRGNMERAPLSPCQL